MCEKKQPNQNEHEQKQNLDEQAPRRVINEAFSLETIDTDNGFMQNFLDNLGNDGDSQNNGMDKNE
jgi:hypothetical protein